MSTPQTIWSAMSANIPTCGCDFAFRLLHAYQNQAQHNQASSNHAHGSQWFLEYHYRNGRTKQYARFTKRRNDGDGRGRHGPDRNSIGKELQGTAGKTALPVAMHCREHLRTVSVECVRHHYNRDTDKQPKRIGIGIGGKPGSDTVYHGVGTDCQRGEKRKAYGALIDLRELAPAASRQQ